jgi:TolA-binding protein
MKIRGVVLVLILLTATAALAQPAIRLPEVSPAATVGQTVGITDITINYHRPAVNKRTIWGGLVPYGVVWRAGANENTTISFSTTVKVEGQTLPAGTYGLFMIPDQSQWTVAFSRFTGGWGAYTYDPSEDAARVTVTPQTVSDSQERMVFTFDDVTNDAATLSLRWEKLRVPVKITVDVPTTVRASIRDTLRSGKHWNSDAWAAAARWELRNGDVDTALKYANRAMDLGVTTTTLRTKAAVLEKKGDIKGATDLRDRAKANANEAESISIAAGTFMQSKKYDDAIAYLSNYVTSHPNSSETWRAYALLGEAYAGKGDHPNAHAAFEKAMAAARDVTERTEVQDSINQLMSEMR